MERLDEAVYSEAIGYFMWSIGLAVAAVLLYRLARRIGEDSYDEVPVVFSYIGMGITGFVALLLFTSAVQHVINPEFYAIRFLISSLGGG